MRIVCQQTILMKYALFFIFEKAAKFKLFLLQIIGGALWVKVNEFPFMGYLVPIYNDTHILLFRWNVSPMLSFLYISL